MNSGRNERGTMAMQGPDGAGSKAAGMRKFLTFEIGGETYGIDIRRVREIIGIMSITAVPTAPGHVKGVINLRGKIVPIVDTRRRLGMEGRESTSRTCIVVVDMETNGTRERTGMIVDEVSEVVQIPDMDIEPPPELWDGAMTEGVEALAKLKEKVIIVLSVDKVLKLVDGVEAA
jgi:purine-binding chemotaxis protein CheW